jgi:predicted transcriptional regulator
MKNNATQKMKPPAVPVPDMSGLTKEQLKEEIEKGFADAAAGQVTPAAEVFAELWKKARM